MKANTTAKMVRRVQARSTLHIGDAFIEAAGQLGIPENKDVEWR
jgi:hypothetical protein